MNRQSYQLGSMSHYLNAKVSGYHDLPEFPAAAPDPSVRNVEPPKAPNPWEKTVVANKAKKKASAEAKRTAAKGFYSEESEAEESDNSSSSEASSGSSSGSSGSESESEKEVVKKNSNTLLLVRISSHSAKASDLNSRSRWMDWEKRRRKLNSMMTVKILRRIRHPLTLVRANLKNP